MKGNNIININDLFSLIARQNEVIRRVKNGGLSMEAALRGTQSIIEGKSSDVVVDNFLQFAPLLRTLGEQQKTLKALNEKMPKSMRVPDSWIDTLDTNSDHVQMFESLETLFVVPTGTLKDTIEFQVKLIELTQPAIYRSTDFDNGIDGTYLDGTADKAMYDTPGIYRVRINLAAYWNKKNGSSVDNTRKQASASGITLAGLVAVGAYALQDPKLYQSLDGVNLPYFDIAELRSGDGGSKAFCSDWCSVGREAYFSSCRSVIVSQLCARPSFV